jgi:hypothetical protein
LPWAKLLLGWFSSGTTVQFPSATKKRPERRFFYAETAQARDDIPTTKQSAKSGVAAAP